MESARFRQEFKKRLKRLRGDMPQKDFAEKLGVSFDSYRQYETRGGFPMDKLQRLAEITACPVEYVVTGRISKESVMPMDEDNLAAIIAAIEDYATSRRLKIGPEKKASLIIILYHDLLEGRAEDLKAKADQLLRLVA